MLVMGSFNLMGKVLMNRAAVCSEQDKQELLRIKKPALPGSVQAGLVFVILKISGICFATLGEQRWWL